MSSRDRLPEARGDFDQTSGRALFNYPPHRAIDIDHMRLQLVIPDMNTPRLHAQAELNVRALGSPASLITLDAAEMQIASVTICLDTDPDVCHAGMFSYDGRTLSVPVDPPLPVGEPATITIEYALNDPPEGLLWTPESPAWPGRAAQIHTQGEPESNRYWFPTHDSPNERITSEVIAWVPKGYIVSSNGRQLDESRGNRRAPMLGDTSLDAAEFSHFHFDQNKPHAPYLVSLVVGKFDVVDIGSRRLPMPVYAPQGRGELVKQTYGHTPEMIDVFSRLFDEPYPWDKYAQVVVWNFGWGGMENTSATTMYDTAVLDKTSLLDGDLDGLISHELGHQWFGDLVTCNSWEHIWLNEGFATYLSHLWFEHHDGADAYQAGVWADYAGIIANDHPSAPFQPAMVSKQYDHPWEVFRRAANPYPKGASILHMLREKLGDEIFFKGVALYIDRHKCWRPAPSEAGAREGPQVNAKMPPWSGGTAETHDFRKALEAVSGLSLERFFNQWCERPGVPHLSIASSYSEGSGELTLSIEQVQNIDGYNPAFLFELPFHVRCADGTVLVPRIAMDERSASITISVPSAPAFVAVDPNLAVLAKLNVTQHAPDAWLAQLRSGPTLASRLQALDGLVTTDAASRPDTAADSVASMVRDGKLHFTLRKAAAEALGRLGADSHITAFAGSLPDDARVRRALVRQLGAAAQRSAVAGNDTHPRLIATLERLVSNDRSYGVRAEAVSQLGAIKAGSSWPLLLKAADTESQHDEIRQAAIDAIAAYDRPESLNTAIRFAAPGVNSRTRPTSIAAVGRLAHHDPERALDVLVTHLADREGRAINAAGQALLLMSSSPRAAEALHAHLASARGESARFRAQSWIDQLSR
ncbi:MAG: HEAT repeat domain-containing protein [Phycisphaerales bacterium]|nr:HEAT repeat domain-containing protein [Phycisphaerales bacterium]